MPGTKRTASGVVGGLLGLIGLSAVAGLLITATVTPAIAVSGMAAKSSISIFDSLPSNLAIDKLMRPTTFYYTDAAGQPQVMANFYEQNRLPVELNEIAPVMIDALLSSEDNRFFTHGGVDLQGTLRALLSNATSDSSSGGSSISQQYVKNVRTQDCQYDAITDEEQVACWEKYTQADGAEGYQRKIQEMRFAIALEQKYSKEDILLGYLNIAAFGGVNYGVDAAARYYFGTPAANLTLNQAATLAGMVQSPDRYRIDRPDSEDNGAANGYALTKDRRDSVIARMVSDGKITAEVGDATIAEPITPVITEVATGCAAAGGIEYYCQMVREIVLSDPAFGGTEQDRRLNMYRGGLKIYTSLNLSLQAAANSTMSEVPSSEPNMQFGAATANIEVGTGRILSISQNTRFSEDRAVLESDPNTNAMVFASDATLGSGSAGFAVGSTFKMFTLVDWLEKGHSVYTNLDGRKNQTFKGEVCDGETWNYANPGNFGGDSSVGYFGTPVKFTETSLNSGYIAMASELKLCDIANVATRMGATTSNENGRGLPITMDSPFQVLGSINISPIAMANAYATIASGGTYCKPHAIDRVTNADDEELAIPDTTCTPNTLTPEVANTAAFVLNKVMTNGTGTAGNPWDGTPLMGKTGTNESTQTWMIESSTEVATAAWVGNYNGEAGIQDRGLQYFRYSLAADVQREANNLYGGDRFPDPAPELIKIQYKDLPDVTGLSIDEATKKLDSLGFRTSVGSTVSSSQPAGTVAQQSPGAGSVQAGTSVTLSPSDGKGDAVPNVVGATLNDAKRTLADAGFKSLGGKCTADPAATGEIVTATDPAAGTTTPTSTKISISYKAKKC